MAYPVLGQDQKLFVGVNANALPPMPTPQPGLPERPQEITHIRWAIDAFPHLPFVLVSPSFHSSLLSPLNIIKIERDGTRFYMAKKNLSKWKNLEKCLLHCAQVLFQSVSQPLTPL